jgi:hypothetical protein
MSYQGERARVCFHESEVGVVACVILGAPWNSMETQNNPASSRAPSLRRLVFHDAARVSDEIYGRRSETARPVTPSPRPGHGVGELSEQRPARVAEISQQVIKEH